MMSQIRKQISSFIDTNHFEINGDEVSYDLIDQIIGFMGELLLIAHFFQLPFYLNILMTNQPFYLEETAEMSFLQDIPVTLIITTSNYHF